MEKFSKLRVDGELLEREDCIKDRVVDAYVRMLAESGDWRPSIDGLEYETLSPMALATLEAPFSEEEVFEALSNLDGDKAPA